MVKLSNIELINMVKEITVAKMTNSDISTTKEGGEYVSDFMQAIYDKLVELNHPTN